MIKDGTNGLTRLSEELKEKLLFNHDADKEENIVNEEIEKNAKVLFKMPQEIMTRIVFGKKDVSDRSMEIMIQAIPAEVISEIVFTYLDDVDLTNILKAGNPGP